MRKRKLDWRRARLSVRPSLSVRDEDEFRGRDAAARWLAWRKKPSRKKRRLGERPS